MAARMRKRMFLTLQGIKSGISAFGLSRVNYSSQSSEGGGGGFDQKIMLTTEDGILKRSGLLMDNHTMYDGKPVYPGKYKQIKLKEGTTVRPGTMLLQQKRLDFHPGLYVGLGRDLTLYAYENGVVYITCEKVAFDWSKPLVVNFYHDQRDMNIYKMYYHVIPKEQEKRFKLVSQT